MARGWISTGCLATVAVLVLLSVGAVLFVYVQAQRTPAARPEYVALGSSFAAGAGLGELQDGSPLICSRSVGGYPQRLARKLQLSIADMSCGGAQARHLIHGGQFFQGPQVRAVTSETRLVTITVGGNDTLYIGDLSQLAARRTGTPYGWLVRRLWTGPRRDRQFAKLEKDLVAVQGTIRKRSPNAVIVLVTYPALLPAAGTCSRVGLSRSEADLMRGVGDRLASVTRSAARKGGAILVDMHAIGQEHDACSAAPWTNGWANGGIAPFHPNAQGAQATADAIARALRGSPAAVAAIGENDAARHKAGRVGRQE